MTRSPNSLAWRTALATGILAGACGAPAPEIDVPVPVVTNPNVRERRESVEYIIRGTTGREIAAEIARLGPESNGRRFAGTHSSRFEYRYTSEIRAGACVPKATVDLVSRVTLPYWADSSRAGSLLQAAWGTYLKALAFHEDNHRLIAFRHVSDFQRKLADLHAPTCSMLAADIRNLAKDITTKSQRAQDAYDRKTRHGATEGASWARQRPDAAVGPTRRDTLPAMSDAAPAPSRPETGVRPSARPRAGRRG
jgi:predicted secreted Zn-dependent protease